MTIEEEIEERVNSGVDLLFIHGILAMSRVPELEKRLYHALNEVSHRLAERQENSESKIFKHKERIRLDKKGR